MGPEEPEADDDPPVATGRARRGLGLIVIALLVIFTNSKLRGMTPMIV